MPFFKYTEDDRVVTVKESPIDSNLVDLLSDLILILSKRFPYRLSNKDFTFFTPA